MTEQCKVCGAELENGELVFREADPLSGLAQFTHCTCHDQAEVYQKEGGGAMSETIHREMRRKAAQPNPFNSPSGRYVVMVESDNATGELTPVHPGHINQADAKKLQRQMWALGLYTRIWTDERYNAEQDRIAAEVFCPRCGEEREGGCKCPSCGEES